MTIDTEAEYHAVFKTEKGDIRIKLFAQEAPITVNNFVFLARDGFYNNTHFHRVRKTSWPRAEIPPIPVPVAPAISSRMRS